MAQKRSLEGKEEEPLTKEYAPTYLEDLPIEQIRAQYCKLNEFFDVFQIKDENKVIQILIDFLRNEKNIIIERGNPDSNRNNELVKEQICTEIRKYYDGHQEDLGLDLILPFPYLVKAAIIASLVRGESDVTKVLLPLRVARKSVKIDMDQDFYDTSTKALKVEGFERRQMKDTFWFSCIHTLFSGVCAGVFVLLPIPGKDTYYCAIQMYRRMCSRDDKKRKYEYMVEMVLTQELYDKHKNIYAKLSDASPCKDQWGGVVPVEENRDIQLDVNGALRVLFEEYRQGNEDSEFSKQLIATFAHRTDHETIQLDDEARANYHSRFYYNSTKNARDTNPPPIETQHKMHTPTFMTPKSALRFLLQITKKLEDVLVVYMPWLETLTMQKADRAQEDVFLVPETMDANDARNTKVTFINEVFWLNGIAGLEPIAPPLLKYPSVHIQNLLLRSAIRNRSLFQPIQWDSDVVLDGTLYQYKGIGHSPLLSYKDNFIQLWSRGALVVQDRPYYSVKTFFKATLLEDAWFFIHSEYTGPQTEWFRENTTLLNRTEDKYTTEEDVVYRQVAALTRLDAD